jgi:hypothetical protein
MPRAPAGTDAMTAVLTPITVTRPSFVKGQAMPGAEPVAQLIEAALHIAQVTEQPHGVLSLHRECAELELARALPSGLWQSQRARRGL